MNWPKPKSFQAGRLARSVLLLAVASATIGGSTLLAAGSAEAAVGTQPGTLVLTPGGSTANPTSTSPTWSTTVGCPSGFQSSAVVKEAHADGTSSSASVFVNSATVPLTGAIPAQPLQGTMAQIQGFGAIPNGGTQELYVICYSGNSGTGNAQPFMDLFVTYSADGSTYTTSATAPAGPVATTTALNAQPSTAQVGATVTLTATVTAADHTSPAGSVQFETGGTAIGTPVAVANGVATTTTTFSAAGTDALSAVFTPTSTTAYNGSTGTFSETVTTTNPNSGTEPLAVTVPATGSFTLTVGTGTVTLTSDAAGSTATGALNPITVSDTRNTSPGWSVSGQTSDFAGSSTAAGKTISGNQLGWVPTDTALATGATLGGTVTPAAPGLGSAAAVLAQAHAGNGVGTSGLGANLTLLIPGGTTAGPYSATLTVTAVTSLP
jgi:hypothetical protein